MRRNFPKPLKVFPNPGPLQGLNTLRRNAKRIANRQANSFFTDIQRQNPSARRRLI